MASLCRNYNSELVAFQARLGEKFDDSKLREAFITADFVDAETKRQEELQIKGGNQLSQLRTNENLAQEGSAIINQTLSAYVRWALPYLPEEGVQAVKNFLTQDQLLAHVSFHIGTLDLILTEVSSRVFFLILLLFCSFTTTLSVKSH